MSEFAAAQACEYLEDMRRSRDKSSVLKMDLMNLRSAAPGVAIFVFEGDDDRAIYSQWIRRLRNAFDYEPFTCRGKRRVLQLKDSVDRDLSGLGEMVFYFVDRDFDGVPAEVSSSCLYVTCTHSVENHLVAEEVVEAILKVEFHCDGAPSVRREVLKCFRDAYSEFLRVTEPYNRLIHAAIRMGVEFAKPFSDKLPHIADVAVDRVGQGSRRPHDFVVCTRQITDDDLRALAAEFDALNPYRDYRGKFSLLFFEKWIAKLAEERRRESSALFSGLRRDVKVRTSEIGLSVLASRSSIPDSLKNFLDSKVFV